MDSLPKDLRRKLVLELSPPDLINFCLSEKKFNEEICDSKDFWRQKIALDYPEVFKYFQTHNLILKNPKNTYIRKFTEISKPIDRFVSYYSPHIHRILYNDIYDAYEKAVKKQPIDYKALSEKYPLGYISIKATEQRLKDLIRSLINMRSVEHRF